MSLPETPRLLVQPECGMKRFYPGHVCSNYGDCPTLREATVEELTADAERRGFRVAGPDDLLIRREDIDYEAAARLFHKQIPHGPWNPTLDQCTCRARARGIVDAALAAAEGEEDE